MHYLTCLPPPACCCCCLPQADALDAEAASLSARLHARDLALPAAAAAEQLAALRVRATELDDLEAQLAEAQMVRVGGGAG